MPEQSTLKTGRSRRPPRGWAKARGITAYQAPPPSRFRRVLRGVANPWLIAGVMIVILASFFTLTYYWFKFSDRIDRQLLSGEIYTPNAGIYSAPKTLKKGEGLTAAELIDYLKTAGYIEKNNRASETRSRYSVDGNRVLIEPGITGTIDGTKAFPALSVTFGKAGKTVDKILEVEAGKEIDAARLEPKMLSTVAAEGDGRRKVVGFTDLPPHLIKAITATEDRSFFEHYGVNVRGIARAFWRRYDSENDGVLENQGGSSITQQLVKNLMLTRDPTWERKITEAYMSVILETRLTKQEIFALYANQIYLGQQSGVAIYGVGEASDVYFGKDVSQITLPEAAFIAGIIRSPNRYGPYKHPDKVTERRNQVIESMLENGDIDATQAANAKAAPLELRKISSRKDLQGMPYFSQFAIEELPKVVSDPEALQHLRVYTSIDPDLQKIAYETVANRLDKLEKTYFSKKPKGNLNAALVAIRPKTGEIVAMVGGRDYLQNQFNRATDAKRQPGSVFKPFVYATAINSAYDGGRVFTAASIIKDEKKTFTYDNRSYAPNNYGDHFSGADITLRDALVKSKNTITVDLGMQVNIGKVMSLAAKAGMPKVEKAYPSMALGSAEASPLEVATAYTTFANLGDRVLPTPITQVTAGDGRTVSIVQPDRKTVLRPDVAYIMDDIMKDVINRGTAAQAQAWGFRNVSGKTAFAGKTGTSRDGWFAGFTPELVCVVYVGFDDNDDLGMKGSDSAMPIWADFMKAALDRHPEWNGDWPMPAGVRKAEIDIRNGTLVRELDAVEPVAAKASPTPTPMTTPVPELEDPAWQTEPIPEPKEVFVTNVPAEFRRVELFIGGTLPSRTMLEQHDENWDVPLDGDIPTSSEEPPPERTPTPVTGTWEQHAEERSPQRNSPEPRSSVLVAVCPITGLRATSRCPGQEVRSFARGSEPKQFCDLHR